MRRSRIGGAKLIARRSWKCYPCSGIRVLNKSRAIKAVDIAPVTNSKRWASNASTAPTIRNAKTWLSGANDCRTTARGSLSRLHSVVRLFLNFNDINTMKKDSRILPVANYSRIARVPLNDFPYRLLVEVTVDRNHAAVFGHDFRGLAFNASSFLYEILLDAYEKIVYIGSSKASCVAIE
jgi:hypothetical protein